MVKLKIAIHKMAQIKRTVGSMVDKMTKHKMAEIKPYVTMQKK